MLEVENHGSRCFVMSDRIKSNHKYLLLMIFMSAYVRFFLFHGIYHMDRWHPVQTN